MYNPFISKALSYGPCVTRGSHSFTCHPHTNHTCLYSPVPSPLFGWYSLHLPLRDGQAEFTWSRSLGQGHRSKKRSLSILFTGGVCSMERQSC